MPDIPAFVPFVDGGAVDADQVSERLYEPKGITPDSLAVINGQITNPNRLAGWDVDRPLARKGFMTKGRTVGATANQDYFNDLFEGGDILSLNPLNTDYVAIPGCGVEFQVLPTDAVAIVGDVVAIAFNWHISLISDPVFNTEEIAGDVSGALPPGNGDNGNWEGLQEVPSVLWKGIRQINPTQNIELTLFINDFPMHRVTRRLIQSRQSVIWSPLFPAVHFNTPVLPDTRHWSGSFIWDASTAAKIPEFLPYILDPLINPMFPGWHSASIRIKFTTSDTGSGPNLGTRQVRVKTRRMSYTLIR